MKEYKLKEYFPVTPHEFYNICFKNPEFYYKYQHNLGNRNIEVSQWAPAPEDRQQRIVRFQTSAANTGHSLRFSHHSKNSDYLEMVPVREIQLVYFDKNVLHFNSMRDSFEVQSEWLVAPKDGGCECSVTIKCSYKGLLLQDKETTASRQVREAYTQFLVQARSEVENYKRERESKSSLEDEFHNADSDSSSVDIARLNEDSTDERSDIDSTAEHSPYELHLSRNYNDSEGEFQDASDILVINSLPETIKTSAIENVILSLQNDVSQLRSFTNNIYNRFQNIEHTVEETQRQQQQLSERLTMTTRHGQYSSSAVVTYGSASPFTSPSRRSQAQPIVSIPSSPASNGLATSSSSIGTSSSLLSSSTNGSGTQQPAQFYSYQLSRLEELTKQVDEERKKRKQLVKHLIDMRRDFDTQIKLLQQQHSSSSSSSSSPLGVTTSWALKGCTTLGFVVIVLGLGFTFASSTSASASSTSGLLSWFLSPFARLRESLLLALTNASSKRPTLTN